MKKLLAFALSVTVAALGVSADTGVTKVITLDPDSSLLWKTVTASSMPVALDWPEGAAKAVVTVDGLTKATVTDATASTVNVEFVRPESAAGEKVVTLSVSYLDSSDVEVLVKSVDLGLVIGTVNATAVPLRRTGGKAWVKAKTSSAVLPIPEKTTAFSVAGTPVPDYDAPGWFYLSMIEPAGVELDLTADGVDYSNTIRGSAGMLFLVR